jgi:hypothetical protein
MNARNIIDKVRRIANNAVYFGDNSNYEDALRIICRKCGMTNDAIGQSYIEEDAPAHTPAPPNDLLDEVRHYIAFGLRQRNSEKIVGTDATVMYWTGYILAMRTVEDSIERKATTPPTAPIIPTCTEPFSRCLDCDERGGCERYREHRGNAGVHTPSEAR